MYRCFRLFLVLICFIFMCTIVHSLVAASEPTVTQHNDKPSIVFEEINYDFGTVTQQKKYIHVFRFRNTGNQPLKIMDIKGT